MKRLSWERQESGTRHPYRDTAIVYAVLAGVIVLVTALTDGNLLPGDAGHKNGLLRLIGQIGAIPVAAAFFVLATGFTWWRWRTRPEETPRPQ